MRQLAKGFNYNNGQDIDSSQSTSSSRVQIKTTTLVEDYDSTNTNKTNDLLRCDCELTKSNRLVDIEGTCHRGDNLTFVSAIYDCGDHISTNLKQINKYCSSLEQFECILNVETTTTINNLGNNQNKTNKKTTSFKTQITKKTTTTTATTFPIEKYYSNLTGFNYNYTWEYNNDYFKFNSSLFTNSNESSYLDSSSFSSFLSAKCLNIIVFMFINYLFLVIIY